MKWIDDQRRSAPVDFQSEKKGGLVVWRGMIVLYMPDARRGDPGYKDIAPALQRKGSCGCMFFFCIAWPSAWEDCV